VLPSLSPARWCQYPIFPLFADETNLFIFDEDESSVKRMATHSIQALNNWFISNKLSMNMST